MKKLIWIFGSLEILSVISVFFFYYTSIEPTIVFGYMISGWPEMFLSATSAWLFTLLTGWAHSYCVSKEKDQQIQELLMLEKGYLSSAKEAESELFSLKNSVFVLDGENRALKSRAQVDHDDRQSLENKITTLEHELTSAGIKLQERLRKKKLTKKKKNGK